VVPSSVEEWRNLNLQVGTRKWTTCSAWKCLLLFLAWLIEVSACHVHVLGNLLRFPKLTCPSLLLLLYVQERPSKGMQRVALGIIEDIEDVRKQQHLFQLVTGTLKIWESLGVKS
jgi:hypothetical protein